MLGFFTTCQCFSLICFALHRVGLQHFGEREGLLAALGSCKKSCSSCFADASERGVQVAVLLLFEARRSGYYVRACGGVKDNPAFLVLAFSTP